MARPTRSLKYEYQLYVEEEIENYKESIPRSVLLGIGDEAVAALCDQPQLALTELLLAQEVDRLIFRRLGLPSYESWRRRRLKLLREMRRPEHWGLRPDDVLVRTLQPANDAHVLVAGATAAVPMLYLVANGCEVTALSEEEEVLQRVLSLAASVGLAERVHAYRADWVGWTPASTLDAVIVTPSALAGLSTSQRAHVIKLLQGATAEGGIHLVETATVTAKALTFRELSNRYKGWAVSVERAATGAELFLARKEVS